jgi:hypothetical protein
MPHPTMVAFFGAVSLFTLCFGMQKGPLLGVIGIQSGPPH